MPIAFNARPLARDDVSANNSTSKLFDSSSRIALHLVLEGSQNSIDAANSSGLGRARVKFRLGKVRASDLHPYGFAQAMLHAGACTDHDIEGTPDSEWIPVLTFEDWSGGLDGDPFDTTSPLGRYLLALGTGVDGKSGRDNGRHGLGSNTGCLASRHRLMYFHSMLPDGRAVSSARMSLASRTIDGQRYAPEIRLGHIDETGVMTGLIEGEEARRMAAVFGFRRDASEPGLCSAVVNPKEGVSFESIVANILGHMFYQVATGRIEFEVECDDTGASAFISAETIDDFISSDAFRQVQDTVRGKNGKTTLQSILEELKDLLAFVRAYPGVEALPIVGVSDTGTVSPEARQAWQSGNPTGRVLAVSAEKADGSRVDGLLATWVKPALPGRTGFDILVRDSIMVIERRSGRVSMTISEGDGIARMIGDSEDAPHMKFTILEARNRGWKDFSVLSHFKRAGERFAAALSGSQDDVDRDMMAARFSLPGSDRPADVPAGAPDEEAAESGVEVVDGQPGRSALLHFRYNPKAMTLTGKLSKAACEAVEAGEVSDIEVTAEYSGMKRNGAGSFGSQESRFSIEGCLEVSTEGITAYLRGITPNLTVVLRDVDPNRDFEVDVKIVDRDLEEAA